MRGYGCFVCAALLACGGGGSKARRVTGNGSDVGKSFSATIEAVGGGSLSTPAAVCTLSVPAMALSADTEITLAVLDKSTGPAGVILASPICDFGPTGTNFAVPATLSLPLPAYVPANRAPALVSLDETDNVWKLVPGATVSSGHIEAPIPHLSRYALRWVIAEDASFFAASTLCEGLSFSSCGGSVIGTWSTGASCGADASSASWYSPYYQAGCEGAYYAEQETNTGNVTFVGDGTFSTSSLRHQRHLIAEVDENCLSALAAAAVSGASCDNINAELVSDFSGLDASSGQCTYVGGLCRCDFSGYTDLPGVSGTWSTLGDNISLNDTAPRPYCVSGSYLLVGDGQGSAFFVYTR